jgi:hypothetical protein
LRVCSVVYRFTALIHASNVADMDAVRIVTSNAVAYLFDWQELYSLAIGFNEKVVTRLRPSVNLFPMA